jgi:ABC-2 type transport system permease protein
MRTLAVLRKCLVEHLRNWVILLLALSCAPFFIYVYYSFFSAQQEVYKVVVHVGDGEEPEARAVVAALRAASQPGAAVAIRVKDAPTTAAGEQELKNRDADAMLVLPRGFSQAVRERAADGTRPGVPVTLHGDVTNQRYILASIFVVSTVEATLAQATSQQPLLRLEERPLKGTGGNFFDLSVPGMLVMATIMLLFTASLAIIREVEAGTMLRLRLSRLRVWEFMTGVCVSELVVGVVGVALAYGLAAALGYRGHGSVGLALAISALSCLSIIATALCVAGISRTANEILVIGNFPFFLLFFFSGSAFPVPKVALLSVAGRALSVNELLPPTHAVAALDKVLSLGGGMADVTFEVLSLAALTVLYGVAGAWLFWRKHLRAA